MALQEQNPTSIRDERANSAVRHFWHSSKPRPPPLKLPLTSPDRLSSTSEEKTVLYLAYGSNLSAETFRGMRGIRPLSSVNVLVPSLVLTFDLAGLPYMEPCFANTAYRTSSLPSNPRYRKNRWPKGLVGVLYEVTTADYRTIIATEGGGASYQDVQVACHPLEPGLALTPDHPEARPVQAHTLLCPRDADRIVRPDPAYAQPSHRYLKLITDGAEEHDLPADYVTYLQGIRGFTVTTWTQRTGRVLFLGLWLPWVVVTMMGGRVLADQRGRVPGWYAKGTGVTFEVMWWMYDVGFKRIWGDGERTVGDVDEEVGKGKGEIWLP